MTAVMTFKLTFASTFSRAFKLTFGQQFVGRLACRGKFKSARSGRFKPARQCQRINRTIVLINHALPRESLLAAFCGFNRGFDFRLQLQIRLTKL